METPGLDAKIETLVRQAVEGDKDAFGSLYEHYLEPIYRYVYYRVGDEMEAEDLTEMVFLRAWEALPRIRRQGGIRNFQAWLYRIGHNLIVDHHKRKKPDEIREEGSVSKGLAIEEMVANRLDSRMLVDLISRLDDRLQEVVILRFINQMSHLETAKMLGLKENHVRVLQYRALKQLRNMMDKD